MKTVLTRLSYLLTCSLAAILAGPAHAGSYTIAEIVPPNDVYPSPAYIRARAVNANGQVTGSYSPNFSGWGQRGFLYSAGTTTDIGTLGGRTEGVAINSAGHITGWSEISATLPANRHAFLYKDGKMTDIHGPGVLASDSTGIGINDSGQVAGNATFVPAGAAFLYSNGVMARLDTFRSSVAYAINSSGQITGFAQWTDMQASAFLPWTVTRVSAFLYGNGVATELGALDGSYSVGAAINDHGQVVGGIRLVQTQINGVVNEPERWLAFLYSDGTMTKLGTLGGRWSSASGINNRGQIVGLSANAAGEQRPYLYSEGRMVDLNTLLPANSGWDLWDVVGINDSGQIAGTGNYNGRTRAFILNPQPSSDVVLSATSLSLTEGGAAGTYAVALSSAPTADVVVTVSPDKQLGVSPATLAFTSANWNMPQTVTVQAIQDGITEGNHTGIVSHVSTSTDVRYNGLAIGKVTVSITDAVIPTVNVSVASGTYWTQADLPVTGTAAPNATVTLTVHNLSTGETRAVSAVAGADSKWSLTLTGLSDGNFELQPESNGVTGNKVTVAFDSHAPLSTLSVTSNNGPTASGWYTSPVNLALTAVDGTGGSGIDRSEHTMDGGAWTTFPSGGLSLNSYGNHTVCYRAIDKAGNTETARCVPIAIDAAAPVVNPVFTSNLLNLNPQDSVSGIAGIEISRDGGLTWSAHSGPIGFTRDGSQTVHYRVTDKAGNQTAGQTTVTVVTVPAITAPTDQTAVEAALQGFVLGSFTDQAADSPWTVDVDWGDGSVHGVFTLNAPGSLGSLPHTYADNGSYTVTVKVTDQAGNTGNKSFKVAVANAAPTATFTATGGPFNEGDFATLTFSNPVDPSPIDTQAGFRYAFDCGDGTGFGAAGTGSTVTCRALDNPGQTVRGRVLDKDGGMTEYSAAIAINNVAPILGAIAGPASPVVRDTPATLTASFTDAGVRDSHTVSIDWDDGTASAGTVAEANGSGSVSASHSYDRPGRYRVTMTLSDKDGASVVGTYTIQVRGGPPAR